MMKRTLLPTVGFVALCLFTAPALAAMVNLTNAGFETGDLTGWTVYPDGGSVTVVSSQAGGAANGTTSWGPAEGLKFAVLKTGSADTWIQLSQQFVANAGDTLAFAYFWDSGDYKVPGTGYWDDEGRVLLVDLSGPSFTTLVHRDVLNDPTDYWGTPWTNVSYTLPSSGTYTLSFEVRNYGDNALDSRLGVDLPAVVPIPAAFLLGFLGLSAAGLGLRKLS